MVEPEPAAEPGERNVVVVESYTGSGTPVVVDGKACFVFGADEVMAVLS